MARELLKPLALAVAGMFHAVFQQQQECFMQ
jgi:hypothetical protein